MSKINKLDFLSLDNNKFTHLSDLISNLTKLTQLQIKDNRLTNYNPTQS